MILCVGIIVALPHSIDVAHRMGSTRDIAGSSTLDGANLVVDAGSREVWVRGNRLEPLLSRKEFDVLNALFQREGEACSKDEIAAAGWPERAGDTGDQEIEQMIHRLRQRIEPDRSSPRHIITMRGYGYKFSQA